MAKVRQIFSNNEFSRKQFRDLLAPQLVSLIVQPEEIWLASPWISDFELLDNKGGEWESIEPNWPLSVLYFSTVLACAIDSGCKLTLVTRDNIHSNKFVKILKRKVECSENLRTIVRDEIHTKGFLTKHIFISGSMNFTYTGLNQSDELNSFTMDDRSISEALIEFRSTYGTDV